VIGWLNTESSRNKTDDVNLAITERSLDVLALRDRDRQTRVGLCPKFLIYYFSVPPCIII